MERIAVSGSGEYDQGVSNVLPDKVPGTHRWIVIVTHYVTHGQARAAAEGNRVNLDHENRIGIHTGCLDCEEEYGKAPPICPADGFDWKAARG